MLLEDSISCPGLSIGKMIGNIFLSGVLNRKSLLLAVAGSECNKKIVLSGPRRRFLPEFDANVYKGLRRRNISCRGSGLLVVVDGSSIEREG
jgi:hypothetical protein